MRKIKKLTSAVLSFMMVCTSIGGFAFGTSADDEDDVRLTLTSSDKLSFSVNDNLQSTYTLNGKTEVYYGKVILEGKLEHGFTIEKGEQIIILNGVTFYDSIEVKKNAIADIILVGKNEVIANTKSVSGFLGYNKNIGKAGINVPVGATLNLSGTGELTAIGSDYKFSYDQEGDNGGAGIGGNYDENSGTINIKEGTITAIAGNYAAGIGGGYDADGGIVNIDGGTITAKGGDRAAGIGGGCCGDSETVNISGGTVNAQGGACAAGIGGGLKGNSETITISCAKVTAIGGEYGAGIGGGHGGDLFCIGGDCGNITISNSWVQAIAGEDAEPIGGGYYDFNSGKVIIDGKVLSKKDRENNKAVGIVLYNTYVYQS